MVLSPRTFPTYLKLGRFPMTDTLPSFQDEIASIQAIQATSQTQETAAKEALQETHKRITRLRERIVAGATTGDKLRDFVIVQFWTLSPEIEETYRQLEATLAGMQGQFILSILLKKEGAGAHRFGQGYERTEVRRYLHLGVLAEEKLKIDVGQDVRCHLSVSGSAGKSECDRSARQHTQIIDISRYAALQQEQLHHDDPAGALDEGHQPVMRILVGDTAVKQWFADESERQLFELEKKARIILFAEMARLAGRPLDEEEFPAIVEKRRRQEREAYWNVLIALGLISAHQMYDHRNRKFRHGEHLQQRTYEKFAAGEAEEFLKRSLTEAVNLELFQDGASLAGLRTVCQQYGIEIP